MKKRYIFLLSLIGFLPNAQAQVLPSFGGSRAGTTGFQFLKINPDARAAGLGGNVVATVADVSALYWNPAGLTAIDTQKIQFQFGHTNYFADMGVNYGGLVFGLGENKIGISVVSLNSGQMPVTTEFQPFGTGETFEAINQTFGLSLARQLTDNFSFGITTKWVHESLAGVNTNNALIDFGFQYRLAPQKVRFAVTISNFGFNAKPTGQIGFITLNAPTTTVRTFETVAVPALFRVGVAYDAIKTTTHQLTLATQLNHPTDNNETLGFAAEYAWNKLFFARTGYEFGADELGLPAFGCGFRFQRNFGMMQLDYGFNNKQRLGSTHRFTIGVGLF